MGASKRGKGQLTSVRTARLVGIGVDVMMMNSAAAVLAAAARRARFLNCMVKMRFRIVSFCLVWVEREEAQEEVERFSVISYYGLVRMETRKAEW